MDQPVRATGGRTRTAVGETTTFDADNAPVPKRSLADKPPFTLSDIKRAIPPHCFRRSVVRSSSYLLRDVAAVAVLLYVALRAIPALPGGPLRLIAWPMYWAAQGCALNSLWVIAHECGHHAFSEHALLDDAVGFALHTALLVPYFSWKHSHRRHHTNSASLDRDEVFVPWRRSELPWYAGAIHGSAPVRLAILVLVLVFGFPLYLMCNITGRPYPRLANHYDPYSPIFSRRERAQVLVSDAGVLTFSLALHRLSAAFGFWTVACVYGVPMLVVNGWLVLITFLHHTDPAVPRYDSAEWDWLRGALATVDRNYGAFLNSAFHNIADTHVVHHLFPSMPHYHAAEATRAIRPVLGEYYRFDSTPIVRAAWRVAKECLYVEPDDRRDGVYWYSSKFKVEPDGRRDT